MVIEDTVDIVVADRLVVDGVLTIFALAEMHNKAYQCVEATLRDHSFLQPCLWLCEWKRFGSRPMKKGFPGKAEPSLSINLGRKTVGIWAQPSSIFTTALAVSLQRN